MIAILWLLLFSLPPLKVAASSPNRYVDALRYHARQPPAPEIVAIARYAARGERIAVWGWAAEYYAQTGTIMATRDAITIGLFNEGPDQQPARQRYLKELRAHPPKVFVDAVHPGAFFKMNDPAKQGLESFPALNEYVRDNYVLKETVGGVRIYVARP